MRLWAVFYAATYLFTLGSGGEREQPGHIVWAAEAPARTLVGDWEPPAGVVLVYGDAWMDAYEVLIEQLTEEVDVTVLAEMGQDLDEVEASFEHLDDSRRARVWSVEYWVDSSWPRDYGPLQVRDRKGAITWLDTLYTVDRPLDDDLPIQLGEWFQTPVEQVEASLDGGALASNGAGLCVSTEEYFALADIDASDEPALQVLMEQIGCEALVLVPALELEDTKHVDLMMQFVSPSAVAIARFDPELAPEDARRADRAARSVAYAAAAMGVDLHIERIDSPPAQGAVYPSFINFLQLRGSTLVPTYDSVDLDVQRRALAQLEDLMPDKALIPVPSDGVLPHGGAVHCLTWGLLRR